MVVDSRECHVYKKENHLFPYPVGPGLLCSNFYLFMLLSIVQIIIYVPIMLIFFKHANKINYMLLIEEAALLEIINFTS